MPRQRKITSLYCSSLTIVYQVIYMACFDSESRRRMAKLHRCLMNNLPHRVLDDLLEFHENVNNPSKIVENYYFYKTVVYSKVRTFKATDNNLTLSNWRTLFRYSFKNLVTLNLSFSCNDDILELISKYCPNLENLDATCKYEKIEFGVNAPYFVLLVTNYGLRFLYECKKLKILKINEPRSNTHGLKSGITLDGIRRLLINIPTIEDISYADLGSVISQDLEDLTVLNLKIVRHFNATLTSLCKIITICVQLKELYLSFFNLEQSMDMWNYFLKSGVKLKVLEVVNLHYLNNFNSLFQWIGESLVILSITNNFVPIEYYNLYGIGSYCPNLVSFSCGKIQNTKSFLLPVNNFNHFTQLEKLHIYGDNIKIKQVLKYLTNYAINLKAIKFMELGNQNVDMDNIFVQIVNSTKLHHIELSERLSFTANGILEVIKKYPLLNYLNVFCNDDCGVILREIREKNYDLVFVNKNRLLNIEN